MSNSILPKDDNFVSRKIELFATKYCYPSEDEAQKTFMLAGGQTVDSFNWEQALLYAKLVDEEYSEFQKAASRVSKQQGAIDALELTEMIDGAFDLVVVAKGFLLSLGVPVEDVFAHGWESNLNKINPDTGTTIKRHDGKILKPEGWKAPNFSQFNPLIFSYDATTGRVTGANE